MGTTYMVVSEQRTGAWLAKTPDGGRLQRPKCCLRDKQETVARLLILDADDRRASCALIALTMACSSTLIKEDIWID
jgi:hypothetical protein